jgi:hypothetical protein
MHEQDGPPGGSPYRRDGGGSPDQAGLPGGRQSVLAPAILGGLTLALTATLVSLWMEDTRHVPTVPLLWLAGALVLPVGMAALNRALGGEHDPEASVLHRPVRQQAHQVVRARLRLVQSARPLELPGVGG